jgi:hypothetical protein
MRQGNPMSIEEKEISVTVSIPETEETVEESPAVVVIAEPADNTELVELRAYKAAAEQAAADETRRIAEQAADDAAVALAIAVAGAAVEETPEDSENQDDVVAEVLEDVAPDVAPDRDHWFYK